MNRVVPISLVSLLFSGCFTSCPAPGGKNGGAYDGRTASSPVDTFGRHNGKVTHVRFAPRTNIVASLSHDGEKSSTIYFWHAASMNVEEAFSAGDFLAYDVLFSNSGTDIALGSMAVFFIRAGDYKLYRTFEADAYIDEKLVDIDQGLSWPFGIKSFEIIKKYHYITALDFSRDDRYIVCGYDDGRVRVWDVRKGTPLIVLKMPSIYGEVTDAVFSPLGNAFAACQEYKRIRVWGFPDYGERVLAGHRGSVNALAFDSVTGHLASASDDGSVRIWDIYSGSVVLVIKGHSDGATAVSFSPDGGYIASGSRDGRVRIWESGTGREVAELSGRGAAINDLSFNSNASLMACACDDAAVRVWDISDLLLCDSPGRVPEPVSPAKLEGRMEFLDDSGDGILNPGERGKIVLTVTNVGQEAAYNLVPMIAGDAGGGDLEIDRPAMIPMILPGGSKRVVIGVSSPGMDVGKVRILTMRVYEYNGFHMSRPVSLTIETAPAGSAR